MKRTSVPRALQDRLGDDGTAAFVEVFNKHQDEMTDDIVRAVVQALEPRFARIEGSFSSIEGRFAGIETRLDQCATKHDLERFALKADIERFALKDDLAHLATKSDLAAYVTTDRFERAMERSDKKFEQMLEKIEGLRVGMAEGFGSMRGDMAAQRADLMKWMFVFWVGQAFVVLAYFRAGQYLAGG